MTTVLIKDILKNRDQYPVFSSLSEVPYEKIWLIQKVNGQETTGPFNGFEMDELFRTNQLERQTKIKRKYIDDNFLNLNRYVKRYYKTIVNKEVPKV